MAWRAFRRWKSRSGRWVVNVCGGTGDDDDG